MRCSLLVVRSTTALLATAAAWFAPPWARAAELAQNSPATRTVSRSENFDRDPHWDAKNNQITGKELPTVKQDFGFSNTNFAGQAAGEMGGLVTRAWEPAFYAVKIESKTLNDKLSASGTFALKKTGPGGGIFFGFFNGDQPGGGGRPIGSLGLNLDTEHSGGRLAVRLITGANQSCGTFITPFIPGKFRPTPLRSDGTRYHFTMNYDPDGAAGRGQFTFTLLSEAHRPDELLKPDLTDAAKEEARTHFPSTTSFKVDLPEGYKQQATLFDHFGLMNMMKSGGNLSIYFDDLEFNGQKQDFARDPNWSASGNQRTYQATDVGGAHKFGYSATNHAGSKPGEIGGVFWRTESNWGYYADRVGTLSLADRLEARGRVKLVVGAPDADMCFGWFRTDGGDTPPNRAGDFVGIKVGGPTRVGHYFLPTFTTATQRGLPDRGPVLKPGKAYEWSLLFDPAANDGNGAITATLGDESATFNLKPGQLKKAADARLDHFGMFSIYPGGQIVHIYLDDLQYTAAGPN
jgi:hypothetical protein